jgi:WhiB family redox-sensing transcriptional regulator
METDDPQAWRERAACKEMDPRIFFPELRENCAQAREVCRQCPVRTDCLDFALATRQRFGFWGGMNVKERDRLARGVPRRPLPPLPSPPRVASFGNGSRAEYARQRYQERKGG